MFWIRFNLKINLILNNLRKAVHQVKKFLIFVAWEEVLWKTLKNPVRKLEVVNLILRLKKS